MEMAKAIRTIFSATWAIRSPAGRGCRRLFRGLRQSTEAPESNQPTRRGQVDPELVRQAWVFQMSAAESDQGQVSDRFRAL